MNSELELQILWLTLPCGQPNFRWRLTHILTAGLAAYFPAGG